MNASLRPHRTDPVAFVFGFVFVAATALAILAQAGGMKDSDVGIWVAGVVLLAAGLVAVAGAASSARRRNDADVTTDPALTTDPTSELGDQTTPTEV